MQNNKREQTKRNKKRKKYETYGEKSEERRNEKCVRIKKYEK